MSFFHEMRQNRNIAGAQIEAGSAQRAAENASKGMAQLEAKVENLAMICRAMWGILQEKHGVTEEELMERVGILANSQSSTLNCTECNRVMNAKHTRCMYCGTERVMGSIFESL